MMLGNYLVMDILFTSANTNHKSHLVTIPPGPHILSDVLVSSPIIAGEDGVPAGLSTGAGYEFGVDPNLDPELALVCFFYKKTN
jgi:26S proteasome regulatory subunit N10